MRVRLLEIDNFRGITKGRVVFQQHTLLVGGNNIGKSTVCEALELVLGLERLYRRPVIDEHDFSDGAYLDNEGDPREIRVRAVLTDLSDEQLRRFCVHVRRWDDEGLFFIDEEQNGLQAADGDGIVWALPIIFVGRYDRDEDDFIGDTFFDHPLPELDELDEDERASLGSGRTQFNRAHKRLCGFIFLRALRTGSRALSLQRGSLLDTILRLGGEGAAEMWRDALWALQGLDPAIGEIEQLKVVRANIRTRLAKFVNLAPSENAVGFFASDLTREHLREVVRLFVATQPSNHSVPFARQGTGSINLLVFALLTIIASSSHPAARDQVRGTANGTVDRHIPFSLRDRAVRPGERGDSLARWEYLLRCTDRHQACQAEDLPYAAPPVCRGNSGPCRLRT